jgi:hypothetical protein
MSCPLVTILIPTYKRAALLPQAIRSALGQTHANLEILILDDSSPDETAATVAPFTGDTRIRYIRHGVNLGLPGNWKFGIKNARGEFLAILHDDDALEPTFVEELLTPLLSDPALAICFCDQWVMDLSGRRSSVESNEMSARFGRNLLSPGRLQDPLRLALVDCSISIAACLFRTSDLSDGFVSEKAAGSNDLWLFYQCLRTGRGAFYIQRRLANYRVHAGGMSAEAPLYMVEGHLFRLEAMLADPALMRIHQRLSALRRRALADKGLHLVHLGRRAEARRALADSLAMGPTGRAVGAMTLAVCGNLGTSIVRRKRGTSNENNQARSPSRSTSAYAG